MRTGLLKRSSRYCEIKQRTLWSVRTNNRSKQNGCHAPDRHWRGAVGTAPEWKHRLEWGGPERKHIPWTNTECHLCRFLLVRLRWPRQTGTRRWGTARPEDIPCSCLPSRTPAWSAGVHPSGRGTRLYPARPPARLQISHSLRRWSASGQTAPWRRMAASPLVKQSEGRETSLLTPTSLGCPPTLKIKTLIVILISVTWVTAAVWRRQRLYITVDSSWPAPPVNSSELSLFSRRNNKSKIKSLHPSEKDKLTNTRESNQGQKHSLCQLCPTCWSKNTDITGLETVPSDAPCCWQGKRPSAG